MSEKKERNERLTRIGGDLTGWFMDHDVDPNEAVIIMASLIGVIAASAPPNVDVVQRIESTIRRVADDVRSRRRPVS